MENVGNGLGDRSAQANGKTNTLPLTTKNLSPALKARLATSTGNVTSHGRMGDVVVLVLKRRRPPIVKATMSGHPESAEAATTVDPDAGVATSVNEPTTTPGTYSKDDAENSDTIDTAALPTAPIEMLLFAIVTAEL